MKYCFEFVSSYNGLAEARSRILFNIEFQDTSRCPSSETGYQVFKMNSVLYKNNN